MTILSEPPTRGVVCPENLADLRPPTIVRALRPSWSWLQRAEGGARASSARSRWWRLRSTDTAPHLRPQADRSQPARRRKAAGSRGGVRRGRARSTARRAGGFSAHGVSPAVHERAEARELRAIDAVCPLVTKVHREARRFAEAGYDIILVGHAGHEEVEGTMGEALTSSSSSSPSRTSTGSACDPQRVDGSPRHALGGRHRGDLPGEVDTALSADRRVTHRGHLLRDDESPAGRQGARRPLRARARDRVENSSNSLRLVEAARSRGTTTYLIDDQSEVARSGWTG